jgi:hypothetical protein
MENYINTNGYNNIIYIDLNGGSNLNKAMTDFANSPVGQEIRLKGMGLAPPVKQVQTNVAQQVGQPNVTKANQLKDSINQNTSTEREKPVEPPVKPVKTKKTNAPPVKTNAPPTTNIVAPVTSQTNAPPVKTNAPPTTNIVAPPTTNIEPSVTSKTNVDQANEIYNSINQDTPSDEINAKIKELKALKNNSDKQEVASIGPNIENANKKLKARQISEKNLVKAKTIQNSITQTTSEKDKQKKIAELKNLLTSEKTPTIKTQIDSIITSLETGQPVAPQEVVTQVAPQEVVTQVAPETTVPKVTAGFPFNMFASPSNYKKQPDGQILNTQTGMIEPINVIEEREAGIKEPAKKALRDIEQKTAGTEQEILAAANSGTDTQKFIANALKRLKKNDNGQILNGDGQPLDLIGVDINETAIQTKISKFKEYIKGILNIIISDYNSNNKLKKTDVLNEFIKNMSIYSNKIPDNPFKLITFARTIRLYIKLVYDSTK